MSQRSCTVRQDPVARMWLLPRPSSRSPLSRRRSALSTPRSFTRRCRADRDRPCRVRRAFVPQDDLPGLLARRHVRPLGAVQPPSDENRLHCLRQNELQRATRLRRRIRPVRQSRSLRERNRRSEAHKENKQAMKQKHRAAGSRSHQFAHLLAASKSLSGAYRQTK